MQRRDRLGPLRPGARELLLARDHGVAGAPPQPANGPLDTLVAGGVPLPQLRLRLLRWELLLLLLLLVVLLLW